MFEMNMFLKNYKSEKINRFCIGKNSNINIS